MQKALTRACGNLVARTTRVSLAGLCYGALPLFSTNPGSAKGFLAFGCCEPKAADDCISITLSQKHVFCKLRCLQLVSLPNLTL